LEHRHIAKGVAKGTGNPVMVVGARTGRDGIHGATFASVELSAESEEKRSAVQVGDPFMEKLLMEACLELIRNEWIIGIQDMGAAGLTSSACEMASRGDSGIEMELALVPRREEGMTPYEIMLSESQERMLIVPKAGSEEQVAEVFTRWGLEAVVVGHVTADGVMRLKENGRIVAEIPAKALTDEAPVYHRPIREPSYLRSLQEAPVEEYRTDKSDREILLTLLARPNLADKEWIYRQYDHQVGTNTITLPGADAAVVRVRESNKALALATDCNARFVYLDPYKGGALAVVEAAQNVACTGALPLAITDCLNFGNPEKPEIFWQFAQACAGISEACRVLETPVTGGNVSLYNENAGRAIFPTPAIGMVGLIDNLSDITPNTFRGAGQTILLLGEWAGRLAGSEYLSVFHGKEEGELPPLNLAEMKQRLDFLLEMIRQGWVQAAHDISEGGLAVALAEMCTICGAVADVDIAPEERIPVLYGERLGRILLAAQEEQAAWIIEVAAQRGVPIRSLGRTAGTRLTITLRNQPTLDIAISECLAARQATLPEALA
jgi:phosphoribosylformylglycinamidine synthase